MTVNPIDEKTALPPTGELPVYTEQAACEEHDHHCRRHSKKRRRVAKFVVATVFLVFLFHLVRHHFRLCRRHGGRHGHGHVHHGHGHVHHGRPKPMFFRKPGDIAWVDADTGFDAYAFPDADADADVHDYDDPEWDWDGPGHPFPARPGETIDECLRGVGEWKPIEREPPHGVGTWATARFEVPPEKLLLFARGSRASGSLKVVEADDDAAKDAVVDIDVLYLDEKALEVARVCRVEDRHGANGIGIFTPRWWHRHPRHDDHRLRLHFEITLTLPKSVPVKELHAALPLFVQKIAELPSHEFETVRLLSTNMPIEADALVGNDVAIRTTNNAITGSFNTTHGLQLITTNGPIKVSVGAINNPDEFKPTAVVLRTTNSPLDASLALHSTARDKTGGMFRIATLTTNSPLTVGFAEQAPDSELSLGALTTNSPARVHLHAAYEGVFTVRTTHFAPVVRVAEEVEDPAGRGRKRQVNTRTVGTSVARGDVEWVPREEPLKANIEVRTTNSPIWLDL